MHDHLYLLQFNFPISFITEMKKQPHTVLFFKFSWHVFEAGFNFRQRV